MKVSALAVGRRANRALPGGSARFGRLSGLVGLIVVMDDGLALDAVTMLLFDDGGPVARLVLLDNRLLANAVPVVIPVSLADGYAGADRANANAHFIRQRRRCEGANGRCNQQKLLHRLLLQMERERNGRRLPPFQWNSHKQTTALRAGPPCESNHHPTKGCVCGNFAVVSPKAVVGSVQDVFELARSER